MKLQNQILKKFTQVYNRPTFKEISNLTGINTTRIFRLFNGQKMRLDEYITFKRVLSKDVGAQELCEKIEMIQSKEILNEIDNVVNRLLAKNRLFAFQKPVLVKGA